MDFSCSPIIRFEIESLKRDICAKIGVVGSEYGELIKVGIDKAVSEYDFDGNVKRIVQGVIQSELEHYFREGDGLIAIKRAVAEAMASAFEKNIA